MSVLEALILLSLVLTAGAVLSRRVQHGYIDFLTLLLAVYFVHSVTRGAALFYWPEWVLLHPVVASASEAEIADALVVTAVSMVGLIVSYLGVTWARTSLELPAREILPLSQRTAAGLLGVGLFFRFLTRLAQYEIIALPDWARNPIEMLGWAALAGVFLASFGWGRIGAWPQRKRAAGLAILGAIAILGVDARFPVSREATLQPILAVVVGRAMGAGQRIGRIVLITVTLCLPLFLWFGAMKTYQGYELGPGPGYYNSIAAVRQHFDLGWGRFIIGSIQDRFHGIESLIVVRAKVPSVRPYEEGSVWAQILTSAFVPRVFYPEKRVGWAIRFAAEFWGMDPAKEGSAGVGISQLGNFYVYGGTAECVIGMTILGAGLGLLAAYLRRRGDVLGHLMFFLTALTISQVDRDLEVSVGGILKLLALFACLLFLSRAASGSAISRTASAPERVLDEIAGGSRRAPPPKPMRRFGSS